MTVAARWHERADAELSELFATTGIDLSVLPPVMTAGELAPAIRSSEGALAQDRYRNRGIPYTRVGRRIRYSRSLVARYLLTQHQPTVNS